MKRTMALIIVIGATFATAGIVDDIIGGISGAGLATMHNQLIEHAQLLDIYRQSVKDVDLARKRLAIMLTNQKRLSRGDEWRGRQEINRLLDELRKVNAKGTHLTTSIAGFDDRYASMVLGPYEYRRHREAGVHLSDVFRRRSDMWTSATYDSLHSTAKVALTHRESLEESGKRLRDSKTTLYDAEGTLQALQAVGEIVASSTEELQKLNALMAANVELITNLQARKLDEETNRVEMMDVPRTEYVGSETARKRGLKAGK